jgi:hypothetical protein
MSLTQSKSLLAKLMATENLHIEQRHAQTASFDVQNRILTIPILDKSISNNQYDLFIGHEVGHALWTPLEGLKQLMDEKISSSVANVVEDSRIERKIKAKYPGLRHIFIKAYNELVESDFFGTKDSDLNKLNFIDRVNLHCKGGIELGIKFDEREKELLNEIETTVTYEDVIEVTKKVCDYMNEIEEEAPPPPAGSQFASDTDESDVPDGETTKKPQNYDNEETKEQSKEGSKDDLDDSTGNSDQKPESIAGLESKNDSQKSDNEKSEKSDKSGKGSGGKSRMDPTAHTDEAFRKNEHRLFSKEFNKRYLYANVPQLKGEDFILGYKELWTQYKSVAQDRYFQRTGQFAAPDWGGDNKVEFKKFREESKKVVAYLVKEFELRKNAEQQKRASISKTGELNMNKIYSYKFNEDIFKKITTVPNGKSHGLVMYIDWSGSMSNHINDTIRQLLNLVMFCKKINIPYEVYAFTNGHHEIVEVKPKIGDMGLSKFKLMNLLSNKMSSSEWAYAAGCLLEYGRGHRYNAYHPDWFGLSSTPLNEAIVSAMDIVPKFRKSNRLQIVNTVFLTDGESDRCGYYYNPELRSESTTRSGTTLVLRDPVTKQEESCDSTDGRAMTNAYLQLLKSRTGANVIGFYILAGRESGTIMKLDPTITSLAEAEIAKKQFRQDKYRVLTSQGYDEYYLLYAEGLDIDEDAEFTVKENATTRGFVSAFSKFTNNRKANRVILGRFIGLIS